MKSLRDMRDYNTDAVTCPLHPQHTEWGRRPECRVCKERHIFEVALMNGCAPFWWEYYNGYCCGCDDELHFCDQQSSVLTIYSARRRRRVCA